MKPFFISIAHSGEKVPNEVFWLQHLPEPILMCDVDRFVDKIYGPVIQKLKIPSVVSQWHRYVVDLNRWPSDIDEDSVLGSENLSGSHPKGLHWSVTTQGDSLISEPLSPQLHESLVNKYFKPFHEQICHQFEQLQKQGSGIVYHLDAHSMPSVGTELHRDPGESRSEIVVSDREGASCPADFRDLVIDSFRRVGFDVGCNWPYVGGRITEAYGNPDEGRYSIQVELNRALYMDETTKQIKKKLFSDVVDLVGEAVEVIYSQIP